MSKPVKPEAGISAGFSKHLSGVPALLGVIFIEFGAVLIQAISIGMTCPTARYGPWIPLPFFSFEAFP